MTPTEILALPMGKNDAEAATVRDYLKALVRRIWEEGEGFSGKRPFGNSGWRCELELALVKAGAIEGKIDVDGYLDDADGAACDRAINDAIDAL